MTTTTRAIQHPDLDDARRGLYANVARNRSAARSARARNATGDERCIVLPRTSNPAMLAAGPVMRARTHAAELARWRRMGTPPAARERSIAA